MRPCRLEKEPPVHCSSSMRQTEMAPSSKSFTRGHKHGPCKHESTKQREDRGFINPAPAACSDEAMDKRRRPSA